MLLAIIFIILSLLLYGFELACFCIMLVLLLVTDYREVDWREWVKVNGVTPL